MHGGISATERRRPSWQRGARALAPDDSASVVVRVVFGRDKRGLGDARVIFGSLQSPIATALTDTSGFVRLRVPAARLAVAVVRVGFHRYTDTVLVRSGFRDTLLLGLGNDQVCLY
jgi:hypothetical protein